MSVSHVFPVRPLLVPANVQLLFTPLLVITLNSDSNSNCRVVASPSTRQRAMKRRCKDVEIIMKQVKTRMWANAQRDGRPVKYRWRPLFNAAKFG